MPYADIATGIQMYYEETGSGEPLVLLYGAAGDHVPWEPQIGPLSKSFRVLGLDNRGTGKSDCIAESWTVELFAQDTVALLDHVGIAKAHLCGMSLGSAIAQEVGIRYPDRVMSLVLCNTWGRTDERLRLFWHHILYLTARAKEATPAEAERWESVIFDMIIWSFFSPHALANRRDLVERWWQLYSSGFREETGNGHWEATLAHDALDRLELIKAPTLVLAGEEDYFTPYYPRLVASLIPDARLELMAGPGSSHGLLWERPDEANAIIESFLRGE